MTLARCSQSLRPGITIKPLHQGLLIQKEGGLHYQTAEWIVLMTISSPPPTRKLQDFSSMLRNHIAKASSRFPQLSENWISRLDWCDSILKQLSTTRHKRAPLGFIGRLSHTLFGTITEDELSEYRQIVLDNRRSLNQTIHRSNLLLSAVKTNRDNIIKNSDHIARVQRYLVSIRSSLSKNFQVMSDSVQQLSLKVKLEHTLVSLEQSTHRIISYFHRRRRQMNSLYSHSLSEDILPPIQLKEILSRAVVARFTAMPLNWYYEHCRVTPVWSTIEEITYKVHLPLHDGQNYILYCLNSFSFPIKPGFSTKVQVKHKVAYSSSTGLVFEPILCRGGSQKICRGGALYDAAKFKCERALISRTAAATAQCKVKVIPTNETVIEESSPGLYVVSTPAISPKLHCHSRGEESVKLTAGVYLISLNYSCTLRGEDWTLPGLKQLVTPFHINNQIAPLSLRTVFSPFSAKHLQKIADAPHWTPIKQLPSIALDPLPQPATYLSLPRLEMLTWVNSSSIIIFIVITIIVLIAVRLCRKYRPLPRLFIRKQQPSAPDQVEMQQLPTSPPESTPNGLVPLYPDLRRDMAS